MGFQILQHVTLGQWIPAFETFNITSGILYSVSLITTDPYSDACNIFAEIGISNFNSDVTARAGILASGYLGARNGISFIGTYPLSSDDYIFISSQSYLKVTLRLFLKIIPYKKEVSKLAI